MIRVERKNPQAIASSIETTSHPFVHLVMSGYQLTDDQLNTPLSSTREEYMWADNLATVYVASENDRLLGSLVIVFLCSTSGNAMGQAFWEELRRENEEMADRAMLQNHLAALVAGIVVDPESRGKGVAQKMYDALIHDFHPSLIVGRTKTPAAVLVRSRLKTHQYQTFYSGCRVTPGEEQANVGVHTPIMMAFGMIAPRIQWLREGWVHIAQDTGISSFIPDTSQLHPVLQQAFSPVIAAQKRLGEKVTVMAPLLSVHQNVFPAGLR